MLQIKNYNIIKFLMSGGLAAVTEYLTFLLFHKFGLFLIFANALSFLCGLVVSFMLNKHWVFSRKGNGPRQFVMYLTLAGLNLILGSALIILLVEELQIPALI